MPAKDLIEQVANGVDPSSVINEMKVGKDVGGAPRFDFPDFGFGIVLKVFPSLMGEADESDVDLSVISVSSAKKTTVKGKPKAVQARLKKALKPIFADFENKIKAALK